MHPGRPSRCIARIPWRRWTAPGTARDTERGVTQRLVGRLEWMVAFWQGTTAAVSALVDTFRFDGVGHALAAVAKAHFRSVPLIARDGGPFAWGPRWIAFVVGLVVVVPVTFGLLVEPGAFAPGPAGTPLCNYPASTMVLLACYPWWSGTRTRLVAAVAYGVLGLVTVLGDDRSRSIWRVPAAGHTTRDEIARVTGYAARSIGYAGRTMLDELVRLDPGLRPGSRPLHDLVGFAGRNWVFLLDERAHR